MKNISEKITFLGNQFNQAKTKTALAQDTFLAMEAFLVTVPPLPIQLINSFSLRLTGNVRQRLGYLLRCEPQTHRQSFDFYRCRSCTIHQAGAIIEREKQGLCTVCKTSIYTTLVGGSGDISLSCIRKNVRASSFYRCFHIKENLLFFIMIVLKRNFSCCGEK